MQAEILMDYKGIVVSRNRAVLQSPQISEMLDKMKKIRGKDRDGNHLPLLTKTSQARSYNLNTPAYSQTKDTDGAPVTPSHPTASNSGEIILRTSNNVD